MRCGLCLSLTCLLILASSAPTQACCGHRMRCHAHRQGYPAMMAPTASPTTVAPATYGSPQMAAAAPTSAPVVATTTPAAPIAAGVQPTYNYPAGATGQPAYYYTYDSSGKMIVAQWMDWVFRGGRAAGEPAPPLPIIGALRNR